MTLGERLKQSSGSSCKGDNGDPPLTAAYSSPGRAGCRGGRALALESGWEAPTLACFRPPLFSRDRVEGLPKRTPQLLRPSSALVLLPTPSLGCTPGLLKACLFLSSSAVANGQTSVALAKKGSPEPIAATKFPRSPSATKSSRLCSSRGSRYPRAPSRFRCSISRRVAAAAGARRGEAAAAAAAWARLRLELRLGCLGACHGPARRPLPWPPAAANQPGFLAGWPGAAPAGGATQGTQKTRSLQEAPSVRTAFSPVVHRRMEIRSSVAGRRARKPPDCARIHPWRRE